jgi:hypothetical protein
MDGQHTVLDSQDFPADMICIISFILDDILLIDPIDQILRCFYRIYIIGKRQLNLCLLDL